MTPYVLIALALIFAWIAFYCAYFIRKNGGKVIPRRKGK